MVGSALSAKHARTHARTLARTLARSLARTLTRLLGAAAHLHTWEQHFKNLPISWIAFGAGCVWAAW